MIWNWCNLTTTLMEFWKTFIITLSILSYALCLLQLLFAFCYLCRGFFNSVLCPKKDATGHFNFYKVLKLYLMCAISSQQKGNTLNSVFCWKISWTFRSKHDLKLIFSTTSCCCSFAILLQHWLCVYFFICVYFFCLAFMPANVSVCLLACYGLCCLVLYVHFVLFFTYVFQFSLSTLLSGEMYCLKSLLKYWIFNLIFNCYSEPSVYHDETPVI